MLPHRANYLLGAQATPSQHRAAEGLVSDAVLTTGEDNPLFTQLERDLLETAGVDIAVAFVLCSGVDRLYPHLEDVLERGGTLRLVVGDYLDITDPVALQRFVDLQALFGTEAVQLRVFESHGQSYHPKAYVLTRTHGGGSAFVGSSNLSESALTHGIEWNFRVASDRDVGGWIRVNEAFESLLHHTKTRMLDQAWLDRYRKRRTARVGMLVSEPVDVVMEPTPPPPEPNAIQCRALEALRTTRLSGYRAGLVVMATGLGKTWLAAFDSAATGFGRILFVAHREEILNQAIATFRRIRPLASIGLYNATEQQRGADILFASVQTLSRSHHLQEFDSKEFDYIVVDEFHHASAPTYRRLIDHFEPKFLLGLTATPERSDGGDLLGLCQENLVFACSVSDGISAGLLCPYRYFGVPDDVDYANIPWRSTRFDEAALTEAVATKARADNILEQWRKRAGARTLAFCVSQRHADFMKRHFESASVLCAAVHSGPTSDGRALSLERLAAEEIQVLFAVDMFNEGVDVPSIDTVMMLRPTESQIIWLQQFGRGLRKFGDKRLTVIDYIGNHRSFLLKARTLLDVQAGNDRELSAALKRAEARDLELPPGCEVTYELEALSIMRALLRTPANAVDALRAYYEDFRDRNGQRPRAAEAFHDGYLPRSSRTAYSSWLGFVNAMGDLDSEERAALGESRSFLDALETTAMSKSYKMLVLQAMLATDSIPGDGVHIDALSTEVARIAQRTPKLANEFGVPIDDARALRAVNVG